MSKTTDVEYLKTLQYGDQINVNKTLSHLHQQLFNQVRRFVRKSKGTSLDAEDVFQDGLLALYKLARRGDLQPSTDIEAYLFTICKNLWIQELRKKRTLIDVEEKNQLFKTEEVAIFNMMKEEEQQEVRRLMGLLGEGCRKVLVNYYYKRMRMREIAEEMNYSSDQVAKNRKSGCMKKLKELMMNSPVFKNQFS